MPTRHDAIVIGGGHNGLVAAAYLARAGLDTVVLEARDAVGGASSTETPFGPDFKITTLSYVMSLMPPQILNDLQLARHGYEVYPMGPGYIPFPDGRSLIHYDDDMTRTQAEYAKFSKADAKALPQWEAWMEGVAAVLGPLLMQTPPRLGSQRPRDLLDQLKLAWQMRGLNARGVGDVTRLFTMSISDLLERWFESPEVQTDLAINGIIGTWAGPREPGTAYVMLHHSIGEVGDGQLGSWGYPRGGMGAVADAICSSAKSFGADVRTASPVERILVRNGKAYGVALMDGTELHADTIVAATHPQITFLRQIDERELPDDFVRDLKDWQSRSGTVKINLAISELPDFTANPGTNLQEHHTGPIELCHSVDYLEKAFIDAREGKAAERPFSDGCIPSVFDRTLCPEGTHVMSLFTQWCPHTWSEEPHTEDLEAYADRVIDGYNELAPNFRSSIIHRQVIGPHQMEHDYHLVGGNIFHGELSTEQLFHMRPAPGYADYTSPIDGLYQCSSATHAGGGVTGIPAYLATRRILRDRKLARWTRRSS